MKPRTQTAEASWSPGFIKIAKEGSWPAATLGAALHKTLVSVPHTSKRDGPFDRTGFPCFI